MVVYTILLKHIQDISFLCITSLLDVSQPVVKILLPLPKELWLLRYEFEL